MASDISTDRLRELLSYDPETGIFRWLRKRRGLVCEGDIAGGFVRGGYLRIQVDGHGYSAHRLAWFYMTGEWPKGDIDHRNGGRADNRWGNLRDLPARLNRQNLRAATSRNKSCGLLGVSWHPRPRPWRASIRVDGKKLHLGYFHTKEEAYATYLSAKRVLHPANTL